MVHNISRMFSFEDDYYGLQDPINGYGLDFSSDPYSGFMENGISKDVFASFTSTSEIRKPATPFTETVVTYGSRPPDENHNINPCHAVRKRTAYGTGRESKKNAPHPDDNYQYEKGPSYQCLARFLLNSAGRMPTNDKMFKAFRVLVDSMNVDRLVKRRLGPMYKWLDDNWDVLGERAQYVFRTQLLH